ncbi:hypothetical protein IGI04_030236 [Brassica rapa subsp. trilocularis]|uniref:Uncharacterized protein n=1 Tax=Brassica rapa subsp. trilocularis TaxID=1813537 RepID=A0ABQ7LQ49_BRACM|nr:hypothetical protein IGI04_030236 [Brassica rapa subsp. trilocularis]
MLTAMWSKRCRPTCNRSHAERHTGCHQPESDWLLSSINRHAHLHISTHPDNFRSSFWEFLRSVTTLVLSRRLEEFLFELRVVQGRPFMVRHAEVSWDKRLLDEFKKGFPLLGSWIMAGGRQCEACVLGVTRQGRLHKHVPTRLGREAA